MRRQQSLRWLFSPIEPPRRWNSYLPRCQLQHIKDGLNMFPGNIAHSPQHRSVLLREAILGAADKLIFVYNLSQKIQMIGWFFISLCIQGNMKNWGLGIFARRLAGPPGALGHAARRRRRLAEWKSDENIRGVCSPSLPILRSAFFILSANSHGQQTEAGLKLDGALCRRRGFIFFIFCRRSARPPTRRLWLTVWPTWSSLVPLASPKAAPLPPLSARYDTTVTLSGSSALSEKSQNQMTKRAKQNGNLQVGMWRPRVDIKFISCCLSELNWCT